MLGTLYIPAGCSLKVSQDRKMSFPTKRLVIYAALAEATPESLYEVLQVKHDASLKEIKTAYRSLAKVHHPDVSVSEGKVFIEIQSAYARLSDPETRAEYDMTLRFNRRRPMMRYRASAEDVLARPGYYTTPRWETDQCW